MRCTRPDLIKRRDDFEVLVRHSAACEGSSVLANEAGSVAMLVRSRVACGAQLCQMPSKSPSPNTTAVAALAPLMAITTQNPTGSAERT